MAANAQVYTQTVVGVAAPARASEAIIATLPSVAISAFNAQVRFVVVIGITPGGSTTAIVVRVRRNTVTGTAIGTAATIPVTASVAAALPYLAAGSEPQGLHSYVVTVEQTGAAADATVNTIAVVALVGN